jgi:acetoin utilization deacetylase AcuC-like enzyme
MTPDTPLAASLVPSPAHALPGHPERPERLERLKKWFTSSASEGLLHVEATPASEDDLIRVHPAEYLAQLQAVCPQGPGYIDPAPTYVTPASYKAAFLAAGGTLAVLDAILYGRARAGFAIVRPPGHHATPDRAMGFCLLNNVAVAARYAQARGLRRIMVFDFDVHHGNGTQAAFESDPDVLYISTHQEDIYPGTGWPEETGIGSGEGTNYNISLPTAAGDEAMDRIFTAVAVPAAARFSPDLILVSAGFDAHWRDPLASLQMTTLGYHSLARGLFDLALHACHGRLLFVLEGGYDAEVVHEGVLACLAALAGTKPPLDELGPATRPEPGIADRIERARSLHHL